jgi:hypothetical protein
MPKKATEWARLVHKYRLLSPTDINAFVGEPFEFADFCFAYGAGKPPRPQSSAPSRLPRHGS